MLTEELHDRMDELEVQRVRANRATSIGDRRDPEDGRALETESHGDTRGRESCDAETGCGGDDVPERAHRRAPAVFQDQIVEATLESMPRGPGRVQLRHRLDDEVPVPRDRVGDEDRPHHRVQGSEAEPRVARRQHRPGELGHRGRDRPQDETEHDDALHPPARTLPHPPVGAHEQGDPREHPEAEHRREVRVGRGDSGARAERIGGDPVDDEARPDNQVGPENERRVNRRERPRTADPLTLRRIREGEMVEGRGHQGDADPGEPGPEQEDVRRGPDRERTLHDLPEVPEDKGEHHE